MAAFDEALAEVGEGEDVAVSVSRQGLGSPQGERDGQVDLPEEGGRGGRVRDGSKRKDGNEAGSGDGNGVRLWWIMEIGNGVEGLG